MSMRGILVINYGGPEVLQYRKDLIIPLPKDNQMLIKVRACAITNEDLFIRQGNLKTITNSKLRLGCENLKTLNLQPSHDQESLNSSDSAWRNSEQLPYTPGTEISGFVERIGSNVKNFNIGDRIYTFIGCISGGSAQFCVVDANNCYRLNPILTFRQGCSLGSTYFNAYKALVYKGNFKPNYKVLISVPWNSPLLFPLIQMSYALGASKISVLQFNKFVEGGGNFERNQIKKLIFSQIDENKNFDESILEILSEQDLKKNRSSLNSENMPASFSSNPSHTPSFYYDLVVDAQANVGLNGCLKHLKPKTGQIVLINSNNLSLNSYILENFQYEFVLQNELKLTGFNFHQSKYKFTEEQKAEISLQLDRWINYGLISPVPGKEFALDQIRDGHRHQLVQSMPFNSVLII